MADISAEISNFQSAIYGEEVRGSMISLANKLNTEIESAVSNAGDATDAANNATTAANDATAAANNATTAANDATAAANEAVKNSNQATADNKQYVDDTVAESKEYVDNAVKEHKKDIDQAVNDSRTAATEAAASALRAEQSAAEARIGYADKGAYESSATYTEGNVVYYDGSTYICVNTGEISGVTPQNDGVSWRYLARGMGSDSINSTIDAVVSLSDWFVGQNSFDSNGETLLDSNGEAILDGRNGDGSYSEFYTATILVSELLSSDDVAILKGSKRLIEEIYSEYYSDNNVAEAIKSVNKNFGILANSVASVSDGAITFYSLKKPEHSIPIGIRIL